MTESALEYTVILVDIPNDPLIPTLGAHNVELIKINDPDIVGVRAYADHDDIMGPEIHGDPKLYCLKHYRGKEDSKAPCLLIVDYDDAQLDLLSFMTGRNLPPSTLQKVRDVMIELREGKMLKRQAKVCVTHFRLEQIIKR